MTILFSNNASSTVAGSIAPTDTTVNIAPGTGIEFPNPINPGDFFCATFYDQATKTINEIVHVTARSGDTFTIVRGQEGTTPAAWNTGDIIANLITAGTMASFVQASAPAADTTIVYTGIDTSTDPTLIVANTVPVPASLQVGMLFNIKMLNAKLPPVTSSGPPPVTGSVLMELNGNAGIAVKRTDGSDFDGGETIGAQEYPFIYNGLSFSSAIMNVPQRPPQNIFYVNGVYGNDYNTGFSDSGTTGTQAFKTIQGAIDRIQERYVSQTGVTIRCSDATYTSGFSVSQNYVAAWSIVGDQANPQNCVIDCTSTVESSFMPNSSPGICVSIGKLANVNVSGFQFKSQYPNVYAQGSLSLSDCWYTAPLYTPVSPHTIVSDSGGAIGLSGNNTFSATVGCGGLFNTGGNATMGLGSSDPLYGNNSYCVFNIVGNPTFYTPASGYGAVATSETNGLIEFLQSQVSFTGGKCTGYEYIATSGGGIYFSGGAINGWLPGTMGGVVQPYGWVEG